MHFIDIIIIAVYFVIMLFIGFWFHRDNNNTEDFYVGSRKMTRWHLGLSVVATDVGGGFSIGLGGLGFVMGISGSWILFTGLIGAWLTAVILIPVVHKTGSKHKLQTFPGILNYHYGKKVALTAAIISSIGYIGFTASQVLAGAKLSSATFSGLSINQAVIIMGAIAIIYTSLGGIKAVIYTDTIQWVILIAGLAFVGVPFALSSMGGWETARSYIAPEMLKLNNIDLQTIINWAFSIIPIWFIGMTLYQRIFSASTVKEAKRAWFIAGLFEYPVMAFLGVFLGMMAKVALLTGIIPVDSFADIDNEAAMPMMLKQVLPTGALGLIMAAYFSAILSTADSCLMAASGNISLDLFKSNRSGNALRISQIMTLVIGIIAVLIALYMPSVLDLMLLSYGFMVSGLLAPVMGFIFFKKPSATAALLSMITGCITLFLIELLNINIPFELDAVVPGLLLSIIVLIFIQFTESNRHT